MSAGWRHRVETDGCDASIYYRSYGGEGAASGIADGYIDLEDWHIAGLCDSSGPPQPRRNRFAGTRSSPLGSTSRLNIANADAPGK